MSPPPRPRRPGRTAPLALLMALLAACVPLSRGGLFPADRDEVHLSWLGNDTWFRQVEFELTEQLAQEILSRPGLHLTSRDNAEVLLEGRVVDVRQAVLSEDPSRTPTARATTITVEMTVREAASGEVLRKRSFVRSAEFTPDLNENLETAQLDVYRYIARDIIRILEVEF